MKLSKYRKEEGAAKVCLCRSQMGAIKKSIACLVSMILMFGGIAGCGAKAKQSAAPTLPAPTATATPLPTPTPPTPIVVGSKGISVDDKYATIHAEYPMISGMQDIALQDSVNASLKSEMQTRVSDLRSAAKTAYDAAARTATTFKKFTLDAKIHIYTNDGTLLSIGVRMSVFNGGAHPNPDSYFCNLINANPGKKLTIGDVFVDATVGKNSVNDQIKNLIAKTPSGYTASTVSVSTKTWFYITKYYLFVVFPVGAIASTATGEPEFKLALTSFSSNLLPQI